jgi:choline kinase
MRAIIIGAGRGSRLGPETREIPKTLVPVMGRPMLDWILDALAEGGFTRSDVTFIAGYAEGVVRDRYPELHIVTNSDWENNNILLSLMCAREDFAEGFVSTYADIVYDGAVVRGLVQSAHEVVLGCDTAWRRRYTGRSEHPETDAEKLRADGSRVVEISRRIPSEAAQGEFVGVMKLGPEGARELCAHFDRVAREYSGREFREGRTFERAYLIDLLQHMLERGTEMHRVDTEGGYMEIDTQQDLAMARTWWETRPSR